jgi:regulatory subunit for Cdc7p protein kinase
MLIIILPRSELLITFKNIDLFYSSSVTHIIADGPTPSYVVADKENDKSLATGRGIHGLKSPFKPTTGRYAINSPSLNNSNLYGISGREDAAVPENLKIWSTAKLDSVLSRCLASRSTSTTKTVSAARPLQQSQHNLARLLQNEKVNGTTECDPNQKRHGFHYFSRGVCFVLLEDMRQELATIAAHEYPVVKDKDAKTPWPMLHCHPKSRNPFAPFDDREKRRWERMQKAEEMEEMERARRRKSQMRQFEALKRKVEDRNHVNKFCDLRRSVSLNNLHRQLAQPNGAHYIDLDADDSVDPTNASGYQASGAGMGYMAASGNSVGITSTTGTTSTSGHSLRNVPLPASIAERMKQQVTTSRKFPVKAEHEVKVRAGTMGPPSKVPTKQQTLKRSKSTNTLRLSKREEGVKPGYCESCRLKFSDFSTVCLRNFFFQS